MSVRSVHGALAIALVAVVGCDELVRGAPGADAGASRPPPAPAPAPAEPREGCTRAGRLESLERDPSCVVQRANEDATRAALRQLAITLEAEPAEVVAGGTALLVLTVKNTSSSEATLSFEARTRPPGPRTDWSRVVGIPEPRGGGSETPRLLFPTTTTDAAGRDVDAVPVLPGSGATPPAPRLLAVHLQPGAKLTRSWSWWALRIPAPAPVVTDDAGHRYHPKTTAVNLAPGEYTVTAELPLAELGREERKVTTRVRVTPVPLPDGGRRR